MGTLNTRQLAIAMRHWGLALRQDHGQKTTTSAGEGVGDIVVLGNGRLLSDDDLCGRDLDLFRYLDLGGGLLVGVVGHDARRGMLKRAATDRKRLELQCVGGESSEGELGNL